MENEKNDTIPTDPVERLRRIARAVADPGSDRATVQEALEVAHDILLTIHGVDRASRDNDGRFRVASRFGEFLSPGYAADTMLDPLRTAKYVRGLLAAVEQARERFPGERIHVLYAGTGPNAPFLWMPALLIDDPAMVGFTLIEVLEDSARAAGKLIQELGLDAYVHGFHTKDATDYSHDNARGGAPHILVVEALRHALQFEPQVAIVRHLLPQLAGGGRDALLVPERIVLRALMTNPVYELSNLKRGERPRTGPRIDLGEVFGLDRENLLRLKAEMGDEEYARMKRFPANTVTVPTELSGADQLSIYTELHFPGGDVLDLWESGLTTPLYLYEPGVSDPGGTVQFSYEVGENPGLRPERQKAPARF